MSWVCSTNLYLRVSISPFCGHVRCSTSIPCFSCPRHKINDFSRELLLLRSEKGLESRRQTPGVAAAPGASWLPRQHVSHARSRDQVPSACRSLSANIPSCSPPRSRFVPASGPSACLRVPPPVPGHVAPASSVCSGRRLGRASVSCQWRPDLFTRVAQLGAFSSRLCLARSSAGLQAPSALRSGDPATSRLT